MRTPAQLLTIAAIAATTVGCTYNAADDGQSPRRTTSPTQPVTNSTQDEDDQTAPAPPACREDFDCCENPNVACGLVCEESVCVTAPASPVEEPPPSEESPPSGPTIDLSVDASWRTDDLLNLPDGTPVAVRTVLDGFTTTDLPAVLRGFVENPITTDARDPYLLLETDPGDERWILTNGPAAGMSGSPIIIEGRLAGALSFSVGDTVAPFLFIATPIEKMLAVEASELTVASPDGESGGTPLSAVLTVPGGATEWFNETNWFNDDFVTIPDDGLGVTGAGSGDAPDLVPGSAIAVLLITGDILNLGGIGTVTAIDGDAIWAFGHPMFGAGPIRIPFSAAEVMAVAGNPFFGAYKIASPSGALLGAITEDRTAAIAGQFGATPPMVATQTDATYAGERMEVAHQTTIVADAFGTAQFAAFSIVWPLTVQRDRASAGSIAFDLTVTVAETDLVGLRSDVVSTSSWVEPDLFFDLLFRLADLIGNSRVPLTLERVELVADVSDERRELAVDGIDVADRIAPGDELVIAVELLSFGSSEPVTQALVLEIPADFPTGFATLEVGPETIVGAPEADRREDEDDDGIPDTAEEIIAAFNALPRSQVLVAVLKSFAPIVPSNGCAPPPSPTEPPPEEPPAEAGGGGVPTAPAEPCPPSDAVGSDEPPPPPPQVRVTIELDAVITGLASESIEVAAPESGGL